MQQEDLDADLILPQEMSEKIQDHEKLKAKIPKIEEKLREAEVSFLLVPFLVIPIDKKQYRGKSWQRKTRFA